VGLSPAEAKQGFQPLFDGKSTTGWYLVKPERAKGEWVAEDGCLTTKGRPWELATEKVYGDFELRFEWKLAPGGNSGVLYRVVKGTHPPTSGPEYQLLDNERHGSDQVATRKTAAAYAIYAPERDATKPAGEWNTARIIVRGNHVEHWLNGERVLAFEMNTPEWNALVAKSKFAKYPRFAKAREGHIVLQDHASPVWFRNLRIREIR